MPYAKWLPKQLPAGFSGPEFLATMTAAGQLLDAQEDLMRQSILAGFPTKGALDSINFPTNPQYALAPSDALDAIGFDRGLPRGVAESPADNGGTKDQAYAARLLGAWQAWKYGGSHYGLLRALAIAGYTNMVIVQQNGRFSELTGSGGTVADMTLGSLMTCADRLTPWTSLPPGWTFSESSDQTFWSIMGVVFTADAANLQSNTERIAVAGATRAHPDRKGMEAEQDDLFGRMGDFGWDGVRLADHANVGRWRELRRQLRADRSR